MTFEIPGSALSKVVEWPPGSERRTTYSPAERAFLKQFIDGLESTPHREGCLRAGMAARELTDEVLCGALGQPADHDRECPRCTLLNEITVLHELKVVFGADLGEDGPREDYEQLGLHDDPRDVEASAAARDEGIARVARGSDSGWVERAFQAVARAVREKELFTSDDVWAHVEKPPEPRALGPVMLRARKLGLCEPTGRYVMSEIPSGHQRPIAEYRSLRFEAA